MNKYLKKIMKKVNPVAKVLMDTTFRQQILKSNKLYNRKKVNKTDVIVSILEKNKITNVGKDTPYNTHTEMEYVEKTYSEEMQDKVEPILCSMHEDYDDEKNNV